MNWSEEKRIRLVGLPSIKLPQGVRCITIGPLLNNWFSIEQLEQVTKVTISCPKMHFNHKQAGLSFPPPHSSKLFNYRAGN